MFRHLPLLGFALLLLGLPRAHGDDGRVLTSDVAPQNMEVRLVAAAISPARGQNLLARLVPVRAADGDPVLVRFPAHSHTTHETTIMNLVRACVDWDGRPAPSDRMNPRWAPAVRRAVFSTPRDGTSRTDDLHRTYFVRFEEAAGDDD
jgi:hypothetical protein